MKTGRFGVGFNSVYHLTDLPSFVSGDKLVFFDPHANHLPVSAANPGIPLQRTTTVQCAQPMQLGLCPLRDAGKMLRLPGNTAVERFPDQFTPYNIFGHTAGQAFDGTVFRLPLRTAEQALSSRLSQNVYTAAQAIKPTLLAARESVCLIAVCA